MQDIPDTPKTAQRANTPIPRATTSRHSGTSVYTATAKALRFHKKDGPSPSHTSMTISIGPEEDLRGQVPAQFTA